MKKIASAIESYIKPLGKMAAMVLELMMNPFKARKTPWEIFFIGAIYSSVAIILSMFVFKEYVGIVMVFLTTLASVYLVQRMLKIEEEKDKTIRGELNILKEHGKALSVFIFLFMGFVVAFSIWYMAMPPELTHQVFGIQERTIECINSVGIEGCLSATTEASFNRIFFNNIKVLLFTLVFAFFYGAGAIFILAWNAAVVGTAVGIFARNSIGTAAGSVGLSSLASYFPIYSAGLMRYMTHGVFEILAYFMTALAGGIISIAVVRHDFRSPEFRKVIFDSADIIALSVGTLLIAAVVEVFVTPMFF